MDGNLLPVMVSSFKPDCGKVVLLNEDKAFHMWLDVWKQQSMHSQNERGKRGVCVKRVSVLTGSSVACKATKGILMFRTASTDDASR